MVWKQPGKVFVGSQPACSQPVLATGQVSWLSKQAKVTGSQPACSHPVVTAGQLTTATGSWHAVFYVAALLNIVAAVMALVVLKPMRIKAMKAQA